MSARSRLRLVMAAIVVGAALPPPWADGAMGLIVLGAVAVTVRSVRRLRGSVGWRRLTEGSVLIGFGPVLSELHHTLRPDVGPLDLGDAVLVCGYALFIAGVRWVLTARTMARQTRAIGDALLVTLWLAVAALAWSGPRLSARLDGYPLLASLLYLPLSLAMVFLVMQLMFGSSTRSPSVTYLALGVGSTAVSELSFLAVAAGDAELRRVAVAAATMGIALLAAAIDHPSAPELEAPVAGQQDPLSAARTRYLVGSFLAVAAALIAFPRPQPYLAVPLAAVAVVTTANLALTLRERERLLVQERQLRASVADIMRAREAAHILHLGGQAVDRLLGNKRYLEADFLLRTAGGWVSVPDEVPARIESEALAPLEAALEAPRPPDGPGDEGADTAGAGAVADAGARAGIRAGAQPGVHRAELRSDLPGVGYLTRLLVPLETGPGGEAHAHALVVEASPVLSTTEIEQVQQITATVERALVAFDLQERDHARRADQRFRLLVQDSGDVVALVDPETRTIELISPTTRRILGRPEAELVGRLLVEHVHPQDRGTLTALLDECVTRPQATPVDVRIRHADGHYVWVSAMIRDQVAEPDIGALVVNLRDINDRKMAELTLAFSEQRYRGLVHSSKDVFAALEPDLTISYISPNVVRLLGFKAPDLVASNLSVVLTEESTRRLTELVIDTERIVHQETVELELLTQSRQVRQAEVTVTARTDGGPGGGGWAITITDITEQRRLEHDLRTRALYDPLTGLPNRSTLHFELQQALQRLGPGQHLGLFHLDINDFKSVNESVGWEIGDDLLLQVAARLRAELRSTDVLARIGGNEFAVITTSEHRYDLVAFAERATRLFDQPFRVADRPRRLAVTVGWDVTADRWAVARDLMDNASVALGTARRDGMPGTSAALRFEPIMKVTVTERFELSADLMGAIDRDELSVVYQPIIELDSRRVRGVEALLRWNHPHRGPVSPAVFIPLAERSGLITELGRWVLARACAQLHHWHTHVEGAEQLSMSINVSARQLEQAGEAARLGQLVADSGVTPRRITIELTESTLIDDPTWIRSQLDLLRGQGMRVAIDDFGTGAAGLGHLRDVPFNVVKIDKSYVDALRQSAEAEALVRGVIELAHGLGAETVAEGIEEPAEFDLLRSLGCELGQGFYMARPMDPAALEAWFAEGRTGAAPSLIARTDVA